MLRFAERYKKEVIPAMKAKFGYKNDMAVPIIDKVVVNTGFGKQVTGVSSDELAKFSQIVLEDLTSICGQRAVLTYSKKSIASFKLRKGIAIGAKVTLRRKKMQDFVDKLIWVSLPRSKDFQGLSPDSIDKTGNLTIGIKEQTIFPEASPDNVKRIFGLEVVISTTAKNKQQGTELLKLLGFPIKTV